MKHILLSPNNRIKFNIPLSRTIKSITIFKFLTQLNLWTLLIYTMNDRLNGISDGSPCVRALSIVNAKQCMRGQRQFSFRIEYTCSYEDRKVETQNKNGTTIQCVRSLYGRFVSFRECLLPPSHTISHVTATRRTWNAFSLHINIHFLTRCLSRSLLLHNTYMHAHTINRICPFRIALFVSFLFVCKWSGSTGAQCIECTLSEAFIDRPAHQNILQYTQCNMSMFETHTHTQRQT